MSKPFDIKKRCFEFAVEIIKITNNLPKTPAGFAIADQLIRSGTSIGANVMEAQDAISRKEFIKTMYIALKECRETIYWLGLLETTNKTADSNIKLLIQEAEELRPILATIIRNTKNNA